MQNGVFGNILYNEHVIFAILILLFGKCYATIRRILVISPKHTMLQSLAQSESCSKRISQDHTIILFMTLFH